MPDLYENPVATMLSAIWDTVKWWLVILGTWSAGLFAGVSIGCGGLPPLHWIIYGPAVSLVAWLVYPTVLAGLATSVMAWYLPMRIESRRLAIGAVIANFTVWMLIGAHASW